MRILRTAEPTLRQLSLEYPVVTITGPRQSGKSTLVRGVFHDKPYVSLEDLDEREFATKDPRGFLSRYPDGAVLDEVQHCPDLFSYLQTIVDKDGRQGLFILTGSQQFGLLNGITQSLAGRVALLSLLPFSLTELSEAGENVESLESLLFSGFYPPIYDRHIHPGRWYGNYVRTYLERDVRQLSQVKDLSTFQRFLRMCAGRTGQLTNYSALANDCGITHNTAKSWLSILEASYILYFVRPHHQNFNKRLIKTPKLYFHDTGLASWLLGIETPSQISTHPSFGALFETFVVGEILKAHAHRGLEPGLFFWQDRTGHEVDLLIERKGRVTPVEIKAGRTVVPDFFKGLEFWKKMTGAPSGDGFVVYGGDSPQDRANGRVLPWRGLSSITDQI